MSAEDKLKHSRKGLLNSRGQSLVEITLITPLLLAALYVAFDFGFAYFTAHYAQNAVREAARYGAVLGDCSVYNPPPICITPGSVPPEPCPGTDPVVQAACTRLPKLLAGAQVTVNLSGTVSSTCRRMVTVTASGTYNYGFYNLLKLIGFSPASTTGITRSAEARYEIQPVGNGPGNC